MNHDEPVEQVVARRSASLYIPISVGAALLFFLLASVTGNYPPVARFGGAAWVGLLTLIVSMPLVISRVKRQARKS